MSFTIFLLFIFKIELDFLGTVCVLLQILPVAHVSSRTKNQITLVNPTAVDLKGYKKKVQKCIDQYKA